MTKKQLTYPLLVIVLFIWGKILYDLFSSPEELRSVSETPQLAELKLIPETVDTFLLLLNYKDPFLGRTAPKRSSAERSTDRPANKANNRVTKKNTKKVTWPQLAYKGIMKSNESDAELGIVLIEKRSYLMAENDERNGLQLVRLYHDSVKFKLGEEEQVFVKKH